MASTRIPVRQFLALLAALCVACAVLAAPGLRAGVLNEFKVGLPSELRQLPGRGERLPATHALVTVAVPANFDPTREWPVMVVSATPDRPVHSSRRLLRAYAGTATANGWILVAADPEEEVSVEQDNVALRFALNRAALAALELSWPGASKAPLAFGGFSGGSKYSGWLAAAFFAVSAAMKRPQSSGLIENGSAPSLSNRFFVSGDATTATSSLFSRSTIGRGVPAGTTIPHQLVTSKPGTPASEIADLCWCPAGRFRMGSPSDEHERRPDEHQVEVALTQGFWVGKYAVTQKLWQQVMGPLPGKLSAGGGEDFRVYNVAEESAYRAWTRSKPVRHKIAPGGGGVPRLLHAPFTCSGSQS